MENFAFDIDSLLSDTSRILGTVRWVAQSGAPIVRISACKYKKAEGKSVVETALPHHLQAGDRVYLHNVSAGLDGFHVVESHPSPAVDTSRLFLIPALVRETKVGGEVRILQTYDVLSPAHLGIKSSMELKALEYSVLETLKVLSPERYRYTMLSMLRSAGGLVEDDFPTKLLRILTAGGLESPETIALELSRAIDKIRAGEPFVAGNTHIAHTSLAIKAAVAHFVPQADLHPEILEAQKSHDYTHDDLLAESGKALNDLSSEISQVSPSELAKIEGLELQKQIREMEILCQMDAGTIGDLRGIPNMLAVIRQLYETISKMLASKDEAEAPAGKLSPDSPTTKKRKSLKSTLGTIEPE